MIERKVGTFAFAEVVALRIKGGWHYIEDGRQARECLHNDFPARGGPSARRAVAASVAFLARTGPEETARVTFIVAAMEAGFQFETGMMTDLMERHVTEAAEAGLNTIAFDIDDGA